MESTVSQINVRIDRSLKEQGDAALAEVGYSPSKAVRALWGVAAQRGERLSQLLHALEGRATAPTREDDDLVEAGHRMVQDFYSSLSIDVSTRCSDEQTWTERYEEAVAGRYAERGLLE